MKIGIFGGSFNPPHRAHYAIAKYLLKNKIVDQIIFVPTGIHYQKEGLIDDVHRMNMISYFAIQEPNISVSDYELKNKCVYTYQTLDYFQSIYPEADIYFILGLDNLLEIKTWKEYKYLLKNYKFLCIDRKIKKETDIHLTEEEWKHIHFIDVPKSMISSTMIRKKIKENLEVVETFPPILEYIKPNHLYE